PRSALAPALARKAQIQIAQRTGDGNRADIEHAFEFLTLERIESGTNLQQLPVGPRLPAQLLGAYRFLVPGQYRGIHDAVGDGLAAQRCPARGTHRRKNAIAARERIEVFADD